MTYPPPVQSTFERARRKQAYRRLARLVRRRRPDPRLLPLEEVRRRLRAFEQSYRGIHPIPVDRIVGTVSRSGEFDRDFLPQRWGLRDRWRRVEQSFPEGDFPPIEVYQLGDSYFVMDGHHRVAIARQRGMTSIDAEVTELRSRWEIPADADLGKIIMAEQERLFMEESGLDRAHPDARIHCTRPQGYRELLESVEIHGYHLMRERDQVLAPDEVAADWYDRVYLPAVENIRAARLTEDFPRATEADLFLWLERRRQELFPEHGGLAYPDAAKMARGSTRARRGRRART